MGLPDGPVHLCRKVRAGSRNLAQEPALTVEGFREAVAVGEAQAAEAARDAWPWSRRAKWGSATAPRPVA
ncbi:nicotinate-nucleotide--dimethylbenzimidazole phosphoribosyltransferase [Mycobacterium sp.]|uniref:nicotinate-nucleotide--dimethylbenzimidazole phosphoribosyltransferase n=1 Tax=Mycobacterium sp. TaxID=1785 RepID=UPI003A837718